MARIHARKKGKSSSTKPASSKDKEWVSYSEKELADIVVNLSKAGNSTSTIGIILRDQYGVPSVRQITKKKITAILKKNNLAPKIPEDLNNLIRRAVKLKSHLDKHIKDTHNKKGLKMMESKIHRLSKYYKTKGYLPQNWRYDLEHAMLEAF